MLPIVLPWHLTLKYATISFLSLAVPLFLLRHASFHSSITIKVQFLIVAAFIGILFSCFWVLAMLGCYSRDVSRTIRRIGSKVCTVIHPLTVKLGTIYVNLLTFPIPPACSGMSEMSQKLIDGLLRNLEHIPLRKRIFHLEIKLLKTLSTTSSCI